MRKAGHFKDREILDKGAAYKVYAGMADAARLHCDAKKGVSTCVANTNSCFLLMELDRFHKMIDEIGYDFKIG
ncbi:MAG: hypothetical protein R2727_01470 [Bacteroidales bacterium]